MHGVNRSAASIANRLASDCQFATSRAPCQQIAFNRRAIACISSELTAAGLVFPHYG
jgi:hypothetical protein